jgi:hypothetical protein
MNLFKIQHFEKIVHITKNYILINNFFNFKMSLE